MPGRRLEIGEHGDIAYRPAPGDRVTASCYYRNGVGRRRRIEATAGSKTAARRQALAMLERVMASGAASGYSVRTTFGQVAEQWFSDIADLVEAGRRSPTTATLYRSVLDRHVMPQLGSVRLSELSTGRVDQFLRECRRSSGYSVAKTARSVVSGVCGFAARRDAIRYNPVREAARLESVPKESRALTVAECLEWLAILDADGRAAEMDLPDLTRFLMGTGLRLGEALALDWCDVDPTHRVVRVDRTVVRVRRRGVLAKSPKSRSGVRVLRLPAWLAELLAAKRSRSGGVGLVFANSVGAYRDVSAVNKEYRRVRAGTAFEWVVPHTYRKTVATLLDQGGLSARTVADQLGHAQISMTQNVYMGRRVVDDSVANTLDAVMPEVATGSVWSGDATNRFAGPRNRYVTVGGVEVPRPVASGQ